MSRQVLLVDDDVDVREAVKELLEDEGYEVHVAANGKDALEKLASLDGVSLAIVDLLMPVMDGVEFIERLRKDLRRQIPCIVMSGTDAPPLPERTRVLQKPVRVPDLLSCIEASS